MMPHLLCKLRLSSGYMAPEYAMQGQLSVKTIWCSSPGNYHKKKEHGLQFITWNGESFGMGEIMRMSTLTNHII